MDMTTFMLALLSAGEHYVYGYPEDGPVEPDVALQLTFDAASGNLTDSVGAVVFTANGSLEYSKAFVAPWNLVQPAIGYINGSNARHQNTAGECPNIGTSDFTAEVIFAVDETLNPFGTNNDNILFYFSATGDGTNRTQLNLRPNSSEIRLTMIYSSTTDANFTCDPALYNDGLPHKLRLVVDRSGNAELFLDGNSLGTSDVSAQVAADVSLAQTAIGNLLFADVSANCYILSFRLSLNLTNNSGGPNGG